MTKFLRTFVRMRPSREFSEVSLLAEDELLVQYPHLLRQNSLERESPRRRSMPRTSQNGMTTSEISSSGGRLGHGLLLYSVASIAGSYCLLRIMRLYNSMRSNSQISQSQSLIWQNAANLERNTDDSSSTVQTESQPQSS
jgi:hypothetical protein